MAIFTAAAKRTFVTVLQFLIPLPSVQSLIHNLGIRLGFSKVNKIKHNKFKLGVLALARTCAARVCIALTTSASVSRSHAFSE